MCIVGLILTIIEIVIMLIWDFVRYGIPSLIIGCILYYVILWVGAKIEDRRSNKE